MSKNNNEAASMVVDMFKASNQSAAAPEVDKEKVEDTVEKPTEQAPVVTELNGEKVMEFINNDESFLFSMLTEKTGREVKSIDDLIVEREKVVEVEKEPDMPELVKEFWKYNVDTGKGVNEWMSANKDWSTESKETVVKEYVSRKEKYTGDNLNTYFDINYKTKDDFKDKSISELEELGYRSDEIEKAKLKEMAFERDYNLGLEYLKEDQEKYKMPSQNFENQRKAEQKEAEDKLKFSQAATAAINSLSEMKIGDITYKPEFDKVKDNLQSVDGIMSLFKDSDGNVDVTKYIATVMRGLDAEKIADIKAQQAVAKHIETEGKEVSHIKTTESQAQASGSQQKAQSFEEIQRMLSGKI